MSNKELSELEQTSRSRPKVIFDQLTFIWFNKNKEPNNWILSRDQNLPFPYLNLIFNNVNKVLANQDELKCI